MQRVGHGYGSACHLLRYLGWHRHLLDQRILEVVGGEAIDWLDMGFAPASTYKGAGSFPDREIIGLAFLPDGHPARVAWKSWWPTTGKAQNWDAIARVRYGEVWEWLLVEAKAHLGEIRSDCRACSPQSIETIGRALEETKYALGAPEQRDWLRGCYQYANHLAALHFLHSHGVPARLLHIYFVGDHGDASRICPATAEGWKDALAVQDTHLGLTEGHALVDRVHKLFLPVIGS
jgi:hypothetical protein